MLGLPLVLLQGDLALDGRQLRLEHADVLRQACCNTLQNRVQLAIAFRLHIFESLDVNGLLIGHLLEL